MQVRSELPAVALPLAARSTLQIDYLKVAVWLLGGLVPWAGITALYLGH